MSKDQKYTLYIDESGDWGYPSFDPNHPVLCLCGTAVPTSTLAQVESDFNRLKKQLFGRPNIVLRRHKVQGQAGEFSRLKTTAQKEACIMALSRHIAGLDLKLFIAALDKLEQFQMYGDGAVDDWLPDDMYCMLLTFIMERYVAFLSESGCRGEIVIESRGRKEDAKVQYWYSCVLNNGTQYYQNWTFQKGLPPTLEFRQKKDNVTGLQISDWIASPFARIVERKTPDQRNEWELYKPKIWLGKGAPAPGQVGFKTFPQNTGRDLLNMPLKSPQGSFEP